MSLGADAVNSWYAEISMYNFDSPGFSSGTGHFTQVVWKSSQKLGVGFALANGGTVIYTVAQYSPPGNYIDQFRENVLPAGSC